MMNRKLIKPFVLGAAAAYSFAVLVLLCAAKSGVLPVQADVAPSKLEANLLGSALHAAVAQQAPHDPNPMPPSNENVIAGAKTYIGRCVRVVMANRRNRITPTADRSIHPLHDCH
jgi:hypothetical protein